MITELKPYPAMKDSGVEWLGDVPEHWKVVPNRALFVEIKDRDWPEEQMLSVTIKRGVIQQAALLEDTSKRDASNLDRSNYKLVQPGDIAYNKMRAWQGAVGVSDYRGIISPAYVVQRPRSGVDPRYFHHLLRTPVFAKEAERWSYGITSDMWSLRPEHFKMIYECLPPPPEQAAIVRYLDHVDRRVRRLVRAKRKLIELLNEQKQAIIHRAVTRGLDPDVPLKDSGIEWLGDVPEHWEVRRLKTLCSMESGDGITAMSIELSGDFPVYGGNGIRGYSAEFNHNGDFVLIGRQGALCGNVHIARDKFWASEHAVVASLRGEHSLEWFAFILEAMNLNQYSIAAAQPGLAVERVLNLWMPIPPGQEQDAITAAIADSTADIDTAITRANREIDLLDEYRTRLIADVVTGKLDVRKVAADLPEDPDEPVPLDKSDDLMGEDGAISDDFDAIPEEV
jgi:type I restriction enzyme, S subunit